MTAAAADEAEEVAVNLGTSMRPTCPSCARRIERKPVAETMRWVEPGCCQ